MSLAQHASLDHGSWCVSLSVDTWFGIPIRFDSVGSYGLELSNLLLFRTCKIKKVWISYVLSVPMTDDKVSERLLENRYVYTLNVGKCNVFIAIDFNLIYEPILL